MKEETEAGLIVQIEEEEREHYGWEYSKYATINTAIRNELRTLVGQYDLIMESISHSDLFLWFNK